ncbi:hypothetical protein OSB04_020452 [Centaurea solstitialis]|uniref:Aminotransferase class I/classII large domain-containing protein n=1 Tax=Centaurea solstitialis TaxID=347529 RepID=A0AA38WF90_9ASTR|nr:hypothetical protein OSB04_020452 [Centaurea solstitialis]
MAIEIVQQPSVGLSKIAVSETHGEDSPYFAGWKAYDENPYHETQNPSGVIQMGLAENQVSFDLLEEYLEANLEAANWGQKVSGFRENALFQDYHGLQSFRKVQFFLPSQYFAVKFQVYKLGFIGNGKFHGTSEGRKAKFNPDRVVLTAGATAANELLTFILADPGDALLVPTPYYPGFDRDLRWRTGVQIVPIHCESSNNFQITPEALEAAYDHARSMNIKVLEEILDFATRKNIHLVSDEIYSGSAFYADEFVSIAEVLESRNYKDSERCHIVYSLSKDLGLPGFRVGTVYSYNDQVVTTARRMSSFTLISSQTQFLLASMLSDKEFTQKYIKINRERLKKRYEMIIDGLKKAGIECLKGNAGLFCWMNLSPYLDDPTVESELAIWKTIMHEVRLNISPGSSCHCSEPGWFRVCFANMSEETLEVALSRIHEFIKKLRKQDRQVL